MALFVILGLIAAKMRHYSLRPLGRAYPLYSLWGVELLYIVLQVHVLCGVYAVLPFARYLQILFILSYIPAILAYSLYRPALIGSGLIVAGSVLNRIAIAANDGHMPVYATLSKLTGYYRETVMQTQDSLHTVLGAGTRLPFLCDFLDTGFSVMSLGDVLMHLFATVLVFSAILALNTRPAENPTETKKKEGSAV